MQNVSRTFFNLPDKIPSELKGVIKSIPEEIANLISHGVGAIFFTIAIPFLLNRALKSQSEHYFISCIIFGISLLMVYGSSTFYHSVYKSSLKKKLRVLDHISIYFLISASFTPFLLVHQQTPKGWVVFSALWIIVFIGSVLKVFFTSRYKVLSTMSYVAMAGLSLFVLGPLSEVISDLSLQWLLIGGSSYLIGVAFYLWKTLIYNHLIWHILVFAGSLSHFLAIWYLV